MCVRETFRSGCHDTGKVTLTFWRRTHHCRLVSMATVTGDERPAPALAQAVLVSTATQALVVEEAGARAELRVLQRRADVAVLKKKNPGRSAVRNTAETHQLPK